MNILLVGIGAHTRRIQLPYCARNARKLGIKNIVFLDVESQKQSLLEQVALYPDLNIQAYFTDKYIDKKLLDKILKEHGIDHVVLGTDPEHHYKYLEYFITKSQNVLMDKPISTVPDAATDLIAAKKIFREFQHLDKLYAQYPNAKVTILSQRRYHPGYNLIRDDLVENFTNTGIIPHYFYLMHSDGQMRFLDELDAIDYHGFNRGVGKISHSGYHFIDTLYLYVKPFVGAGKITDFVVTCHKLSPADYSQHLDHEIVSKLFQTNAEPSGVDSSGEIDAYASIQFKSGSTLVATARIDMLHSGFSDRLNYRPNEANLYKGNGRIRHEKQVVMQGPIYAAYIDSLQSKQVDPTLDGGTLLDVGGEHHFDLVRFNHSFTDKKIIEKHKISDLMDISELGLSRGHQEEARYMCLDDFFSSCGDDRRSDVSDLSDHMFSALLMSKLYESLASDKPTKASLV
jgi:predicted dehydrogenase